MGKIERGCKKFAVFLQKIYPPSGLTTWSRMQQLLEPQSPKTNACRDFNTGEQAALDARERERRQAGAWGVFRSEANDLREQQLAVNDTRENKALSDKFEASNNV